MEIKNTKELRHLLLEELSKLRKGEVSAQYANSVAKISDKIVGTLRIELDIDKHAKTNHGTIPLTPVEI